MPSDMNLSKKLSWLLRHGLNDTNMTVLSGGYVYVSDILRLRQFRGITASDIMQVVDNDSKQRYNLTKYDETKKIMIRANQGHSVDVGSAHLVKVDDISTIPFLIHGTYRRCLDSIKKQGLSRMNRCHIHFAAAMPTEDGVISGMRGSCDIFLQLDVPNAVKAGLEFYRSENNVILCPGNEDGVILPQFLVAFDRRSKRRIF